MDLKKYTLIDDCFIKARFGSKNGDIEIEAEVFPGCPAFIEHAIWVETGEPALEHVAANMPAVQKKIRSVVDGFFAK
ncbi:hypothetical protein [Pararhodobacter oceanensis]|uniref:Uncharacterized protein n=1 Tax=Pararhodobacter oceanensis TaxID=2172121 RepID=A0A2T8HPS6_9RHOB|nr:hypothetical protein [Pararhodobacter oceanensis]PVH27416.1 hypothetical protein DDE20_17470 [Pararhodobacter oceanensis]